MTSITEYMENLINQFKITNSESVLEDIKLKIFEFATLPPSSLDPNPQEYLAASKFIHFILGNALEAEMDYYLKSKNEAGFDIAFQQIKQFYYEFSHIIPESSRKLYFVGLYLLHLLSSNRNTEYCFELEFLGPKDYLDEHISLPIEIEQCISEGNYNKLLNLNRAVSDPAYHFYLDKLSMSIKYQIAMSIQKSFTSLFVKDALDLLLMSNTSELSTYILEELIKNPNQDIQWVIQDDKLHFREVSKDKNFVPSHKIVSDTIKLAQEIEKII